MRQDDIFKTIFKKTFDSSEAYFLKNITDEYPYFSLAHFFKLKKDTVYDESSAAKAALHFQNPFLLNFRLNDPETEAGKLPVEWMVQPVHNSDEHHSPAASATIESQSIIHESVFKGEVQNNTPLNQHNETLSSDSNEAAMQQEEKSQIPVVDGALQNLLDKNSLLKPEEEYKAQEEKPQPLNQNLPEAQQTMPEPVVPLVSPGLPQEWLFEPLHTTDYFASQGIKISEETATSDTLGKQLKSFTEWLKTMKKASHYKVSPDAPLDRTVEHLAEKSNQEQDIVTETMAEAYIKQGKLEKARETYQKLSLLNPSKSAYFAAQIEYLKEI